MKTKLYARIASCITAMANCEKSEWHKKHNDTIQTLVREHLPSGSGFDAGTMLDYDRSTGNTLVFIVAYHHMNDGGYYDGWTEHTVIVTPSLTFGFELRITGRDRNQIKDYIADTFQHALAVEVD